MDEATIQKIAAEVARHLPSHAWVLLLVQIVLLAAAAAVGAFFGEYLKTRGKNLATKADFDSLQDQLRANTQLVETIKSEVGQKDWAQREWTNLRRTKLEALLEKMHDCEAWLDRHRSSCMEGKSEPERDHLNELDVIGTLYFPELQQELTRFYLAGKQMLVQGIQLAQALNTAGNDMAARQNAYDTFKGEWGDCYKQEFAPARKALTEAARRLLVNIMGAAD